MPQTLRGATPLLACAGFLLLPAVTPPPGNGPDSPSEQAETNKQTGCPGDGTEKGDPVEIFTGSLVLNETDLTVSGLGGMGIGITRHYSSGTVLDSFLGKRWNLNWFQRIVVEYGMVTVPRYLGPADAMYRVLTTTEDGPGGGGPSGAAPAGGGSTSHTISRMVPRGVFYYNGESRVDRFTFAPGGGLQSPPGYFSKLLPMGGPLAFFSPDSFQLRTPGGTVLTFDVVDLHTPLNTGNCRTYWLSRIQDRMGRTIRLDYEVVGTGIYAFHRPKTLWDTYGRPFQFGYDAAGYLESVADFVGRVVRYEHDAWGNLTAVVSPPVEGFPAGKRKVYRYDQSGIASKRHDLVEAIDAREVMDGSMQPSLQNAYDYNHRVTQQIAGGLKDGVMSGGRFLFLHDEPSTSWQGIFVKSRVLTISPNGNCELNLFSGEGFNVAQIRYSGRLRPESISPYSPISSLINYDWLSLNSAVGGYEPPLRQLYPSLPADPPSFVRRAWYNSDGLLVREEGPGSKVEHVYNSASPDRFQQGNRIKTIHYDLAASTPSLESWTIYEPLYNQIRGEVDPRGIFPGFVGPDGVAGSPNRYLRQKIFDYQECSLDLGPGGSAPQALKDMVSRWGIDLAQANHASLYPNLVLSSMPAASDLPDQNLDGRRDQFLGNVIVQCAPDVGAQVVKTLAVYNDFSLTKAVRDPEGFWTNLEYFPANDPDGDGEDPISGNSSVAGGNGGGLLRRMLLPEGVAQSIERDKLGRIVREIDGRGFAKRTLYNALDQIVQRTNAAGHWTRYVYDANDRVVEERLTSGLIEQADAVPFPGGGSGPGTGGGGGILHRFEYDLMGQKILEDNPGTDNSDRRITRFRYDRGGNLALTLYPEWGNDPDNCSSSIFDERTLCLESSRGGVSQAFRQISANADIVAELGVSLRTNPVLLSSEVSAFDAEGNLVQRRDGEGRLSLLAYDGFQRLKEARDPLGDATHTMYDPASNLVETWTIDSLGVELRRTRGFYDEIGRNYQMDAATYGQIEEGVASPGDSWVTTRKFFDAKGQIVQITDDNGVSSHRGYDGLGRLVWESDDAGNRKDHAYDKNGNRIRTVLTEISASTGLAQSFTSRSFYDALDRLVATVDPRGNTQRSQYDARGNLTLSSDARGPVTAPLSGLNVFSEPEHGTLSGFVNERGNTVRYSYDFANRLVATRRHLRAGGEGNSPVDPAQGGGDGKVTTTQIWDKNGRLVGQIDDAGNNTEYEYDALDRRIRSKFADGTQEQVLSYDRTDLPVLTIDPNQNAITNLYDGGGRLYRRTIQRGPGVFGSTEELFEYDGLGRLKRAENRNGAATISVVRREYDSMSRVRQERLTFGAESSGASYVASLLYDGAGNLKRTDYPGGRAILRSYDAQNRSKTVDDGATRIAKYSYEGSRVEWRKLGHDSASGGYLTTMQMAYDDARRPITVTHTRADGALLDQRSSAWDRNSNLVSRTGGGHLHEYDYDSIDQMIRSKRDGNLRNSYQLDGVLNRSSVNGQSYFMNGGSPEPADRQMNQYTQVPGDLGARSYDKNGNLGAVPGRAQMIYDYRNRLVEYREASPGTRIHQFVYDALGRRIIKRVDVQNASLTVETRYVLAGQQILETRNAAGAIQASFVYGNGVDEVLQMKAGSVAYSYHADAMGNVFKLTRDGGSYQENYDYDDFGRILTGSLNPMNAAPASGNPFFFTGRGFDWETGLYDFRTRCMDPLIGRFTSRDSIGIWGDPINCGNGAAYCGNNPWSRVDPFGLSGNSGDDLTFEVIKLKNGNKVYVSTEKEKGFWWWSNDKVKTTFEVVDKNGETVETIISTHEIDGKGPEAKSTGVGLEVVRGNGEIVKTAVEELGGELGSIVRNVGAAAASAVTIIEAISQLSTEGQIEYLDAYADLVEGVIKSQEDGLPHYIEGVAKFGEINLKLTGNPLSVEAVLNTVIALKNHGKFDKAAARELVKQLRARIRELKKKQEADHKEKIREQNKNSIKNRGDMLSSKCNEEKQKETIAQQNADSKNPDKNKGDCSTGDAARGDMGHHGSAGD